MIKFELAQQLKDAGFPQRSDSQHHFYENDVYIPNLSQLIKECGNHFKQLYRTELTDPGYEGKVTWTALGVVAGENAVADNPDEAVAELWLKIGRDKE